MLISNINSHLIIFASINQYSFDLLPSLFGCCSFNPSDRRHLCWAVTAVTASGSLLRRRPCLMEFPRVTAASKQLLSLPEELIFLASLL